MNRGAGIAAPGAIAPDAKSAFDISLFCTTFLGVNYIK